MKRDLYSEVSEKILAELQNGSAPWVKPWASIPAAGHPANAATGRPYSGVNVILLWIAAQDAGWPTLKFLTFKQALDVGGHVRKGEKGHKVVFVKQLTVRDKNAPADASADDAERTFNMLREYTVFNIAQCDGLPERITAPIAPRPPRHADARDPLADDFVAATRAAIAYGHGQAFYAPSRDQICMPDFATFKNGDNFYATLFHELAHWTGHPSRLDRLKKARFGSEEYAFEELIAELCAAFLCAEFAFDGDLRHAGYIGHWIKLLKDHPKAFIQACAAAQRAADHMRGLALADATPDAIAA